MMIFACVLLALCYSTKADEAIPEYSSKCPPIDSLTDFDDNLFPGPWYEVVASTSVLNNCTIYKCQYLGDHKLHSIARTIYPNGTHDSVDFRWRTGYPPNSKLKVLDLFEKFTYHAIMYVLELTKERLTTYECFEYGNGITELIHVYTHKEDFDMNSVKSVLQAHNLSRIPIKEAYRGCPPDWDKF